MVTLKPWYQESTNKVINFTSQVPIIGQGEIDILTVEWHKYWDICFGLPGFGNKFYNAFFSLWWPLCSVFFRGLGIQAWTADLSILRIPLT